MRKQISSIDPSTTGAISELIVAIDLMKQGFGVYRAISPSCYADLIAIKDDDIKQYEVRTGQYFIKKNGDMVLNYPKVRTANKLLAIYTALDNKIHYID